MSDELTPEQVAELVEQIDRGSDPYELPQELIEESEPSAAPAADEGEVERSLYYQILKMTVGEKLKAALKGNRDTRNILVRDSNRLVARFVLQNPRITDDEIVGIARNRNLDTDILRIVGEHKEWSHNPQVRSALVSNPKTPVAISLRCVNSLSERELRLLAKSKNIPSAVASSAKRLLLQRTGH
jgi:hypothetical protein